MQAKKGGANLFWNNSFPKISTAQMRITSNPEATGSGSWTIENQPTNNLPATVVKRITFHLSD